MADPASDPRAGPVYIYLPYVDEQGTGMQRYGSQMILALLATGIDARVLIGEVHGRPGWLATVPHRVVIGKRLSALLPRPFMALARILWLQFALPFVAAKGSTLLALADEVAPFPRVRQIAVAHDLTQAGPHARRRNAVVRIRHLLWVAGLKRSEIVIAISDATRSDIVTTLGIDPRKVPVVHEGYDPAVFTTAAAAQPRQRPYLLYAGTLAPNKNIPFLLDVYARLRARFACDLTLVGKQAPAEVTALMAAVPAGIRDGIDFAGFVSDAQLAALMQGCAAFVFPSLNEGFGLAPVEAMACGAPVVSSDAGSLREVVADGGVLLKPDDTDGWVAELGRILTDEAYRRALSGKALDRSSVFSWTQAAEAYSRLL